MTLSAICYGSLIGFIVIDMDENDGITGLKLASLTTVAMFIVVAVTGINFANPIFVSIVVVLIFILLLSELYSMFNQISRGARRKKAIAGVIIFSMSLLASISSVDVSAEQGINDWDTAIFFAFSMYLDIINIILYFLELMGNS
jgi:FtsH-binding integral membrane protein